MVLPIDGQPVDWFLIITALGQEGGYFLCLRPMAYPNPNAVSTRLITAIRSVIEKGNNYAAIFI